MHRQYHSYWQRFDQPDPYDGSYNLTDPQSLNRYSYVQNDPVNFVDPSGLNMSETICSYGVVGTRPHPEHPERNAYVWGWTCVTETWDSGRRDPPGIGDGGGGTQNPAPQQPTDCQRFANMVEEIAGRSNNAQDFMNEMARTFTAGNDSSISELHRTGNMAARTRFTADGFKPQFFDTSNQVRHFTAGLIASYNLGATAGRIAMNSNEWGGNEADARADYALNRVSTRLGAQNVVPYPAYTTGGNIRGERYEVRHPARPGYGDLADLIRRQVCQ